ncbi:KTSC domain-containing protein [Acinetobacter wuhouensis]|uniref:KTSC domain-containing protein n=1 Tax=Acinetobacter wuhouensis TaxID=1879050 RepID=UPI000A32EE19|nr:KTSC domain-containing protein [Acinetobacter wuhouensis]AXQ22608.1 KTSC domain-containing protein [Acinetobacter wuhouensis]
MQRTRVSSSNIHSIGYDSSISRLEVEFLNGSIYQYFNVPERLYIQLMNASSHGEYLDAYIKKGGYSYIKVR